MSGFAQSIALIALFLLPPILIGVMAYWRRDGR